MKANCWEYKHCGREEGGANASERGPCRASTHAACDGINTGANAGRICWSIAGTLSGGTAECCFAEEQLTCLDCDFYQKVEEEEGGAFHHLLLGRETVSPEELQEKLFEMQRLLHVGHKLLADVDLNEVLRTLVEEACRVVDAERGTVYTIDEATHSLRSKVIRADELSEVVVPIDETSIAGFVASNRVTVNIADAYEDLRHISPTLRFNRSFDEESGYRTRSVLAVPIHAGSRLVGVLQVLNKKGGAFSPENEWFLCRFATEAGLALHNARLFDDIRSLKELDRLKSEFADMLTHELKSPLAAIRMTLDVLLRPGMDVSEEKKHDFLLRIKDRTAKLADLIGEIMELSKIKRGEKLGHVQPQPLKGITASVLGELGGNAEHRSIALSVALPDSDPRVRADEQSLKLIVSNLVSNAIKYSPDGATVEIALQDRPTEVVLQVADQGIGIPEAEQKQLFSEFFRASNAKQSRIEGTGLGLAGVKQLVERFGGDIWFKSKESEGSTFFAKFPKAAAPPE